jgi:hypothetical protein
MNTTTTATRLTQTVMIGAILAAAFMAKAADTSVATAMPVLTLPHVTVIGHRNPPTLAIVQMPKVMVIGHRDTALAVVQMPKVMVIGHRSEAAPVLARKDETLPKARKA